jgi:hypothetical protein
MTSRALRATGTVDPALESDLLAYARATEMDPPPGLVERVMAEIAATPRPRRWGAWSWSSVHAAWSSTPRLHAAAALVLLVMATTAGLALAVAGAGTAARQDVPSIDFSSAPPLPSEPAAAPTGSAERPGGSDPASAVPLIAAPTLTPDDAGTTPTSTARTPRVDDHDGDDGAEATDGADATDGAEPDDDSGDPDDASTDSPGSTDSPEPTASAAEDDQPSDPE